MKCEIKIDRLHLYGYHGVMELERKVGNEYEVSANILFERNRDTFESDSLESSINYATVVECIKKDFSRPSFLIEKVASNILRGISTLLEEYDFTVDTISVTVTKLTPPIPNCDVQGISVTLSI